MKALRSPPWSIVRREGMGKEVYIIEKFMPEAKGLQRPPNSFRIARDAI